MNIEARIRRLEKAAPAPLMITYTDETGTTRTVTARDFVAAGGIERHTVFHCTGGNLDDLDLILSALHSAID